MTSNNRRALGGLAVALSLIVYVAALIYAGVRSYTLFAATIDPALLPLAVLGIIALELSAIALPLALHFWTAPGAQRYAAYGFYLLDLGLIVGNAVLDAAHHSGAILPTFMQAYGTFMVPGLPVLCMAGWALLWTLDPASREADMVASVRTATQASMLERIKDACDSADITQAVQSAAEEAARALVGETLGRAPKQHQQLPKIRQNFDVPTIQAAADILSRPDDMPTGGYPVAKKNGHRKEAETGPKSS